MSAAEAERVLRELRTHIEGELAAAQRFRPVRPRAVALVEERLAAIDKAIVALRKEVAHAP